MDEGDVEIVGCERYYWKFRTAVTRLPRFDIVMCAPGSVISVSGTLAFSNASYSASRGVDGTLSPTEESKEQGFGVASSRESTCLANLATVPVSGTGGVAAQAATDTLRLRQVRSVLRRR